MGMESTVREALWAKPLTFEHMDCDVEVPFPEPASRRCAIWVGDGRTGDEVRQQPDPEERSAPP